MTSIDGELPDKGTDVPEGWSVLPLGECVDVLDHLRVPVNSDDRQNRQGNVPYYGATGQVGWIDDHLFDEELVLLGEDGAPFLDKSKPIAFLIHGKTWVNNHAHVLRAKRAVAQNSYIKYALDAFDFADHVNGTTRLKLTQGAMRTIPLPLPPLAEQKRIAAKVEELLTRVNAARARLAKAPAILKRFRQSVLAAACSGELTADWRESRGELGAEETVQSRLRLGKDSPASPWVDTSFEHRDRDELPGGWEWVGLGNLGQWGSGGTPSKSRSDYWQNGTFPWVSPKDMKSPFITDAQDHITRKALAETTVHLLPPESLLFVVRGMILAHTFPVALTLSEVTINQDMRSLKPHSGIEPRYLLFALQSAAMQILFAVKEATHGTLRLDTETLKPWPIPVPPPPEQREIVRRVESLFALADKIESRVRSGTAKVEKITQAILAKAFRGELVPTEAELARREGRDYEPASALLARIKAAAAGETSSPKRRRPRRSAASTQ